MKKLILTALLISSYAGWSQINSATSSKKITNTEFFVTANFGASFRLAKVSNDLDAQTKRHYKDMNKGTSIDLGLYFRHPYNGMAYGLKFNQYKASATNNFSTIYDFDPVIYTYKLEGEITMTFIAASFMKEEFFGKNNSQSAGFEMSLGYYGYNEDEKYIEYGVKDNVKGANLGISIGGFYQIQVVKGLFVGPNISFLGTALRKFEATYSDGTTQTIKLDEENAESLWRFDLQLGAKYTF